MNPKDTAPARSVLLVDDDETTLRTLQLLLARQGCEVSCANGVAVAVQMLATRAKHFDLVITDMRMPDASGKTIVSAVKTAFPDTPVIVTTAYENDEVRAECLELGAAAYLVKPFDFAQLRVAMEQALGAVAV